MSAVAQLALDVRGFLAGMDLAKQAINNFRDDSGKVDEGNGMGKLKVAAVGLAAGIAALGTMVYKGVQSSIELGARLVDISYKSGLAAAQVMALERAMDEVGGKTEDVVPATDKFNSAIQQAAGNTGPLVGILQKAGITMEQLAGMDVASRMQAVAAAIRDIKHPTEQAQGAMAAFGASGAKMVAALAPENLNSAAAALGSQAEIMQANAGVFARIMQLMGAQGSSLNSLAIAVKGKLQGLFAGIASGIAPTILKIMEASAKGGSSLADSIRQFSPALEPLAQLVDSLVKMDLAGVGAKLGAGAAAIVEALMNGDAIEFLKAGLTIVASEFRGMMQAAVGGLSAAFDALIGGLNFQDILSGFASGMVAIVNLFLGMWQQGMAKLMKDLRESSVVYNQLITPQSVTQLAAMAGKNLVSGKQGLETASQQIATATRDAASRLASNAKSIPDAFAKGASEAQKMSQQDADQARSVMSDIISRSTETAARTAAQLREQFATPAVREQVINLPETAATAGQAPLGSIVSSLARIGGDIAGPQTNALDISRAQLVAQQQTARNTQIMADRLRSPSSAGNMVPVYQ